ncbi:MAG: 3-hydroxylacyl-ACP dehydratase [Casimicrobiaceae bacterium]
MQLDRAWIACRIPHQQRMCLLDGVLEWDSSRVVCRATSHRDPENPLRAHGRLAAACGIEYAAQAMAVHGALLAPSGERPRAGYLTSVREVTLLAMRLDDIPEDLEIEALRRSGDDNNVLYGFAVRAAGRELLRGRAAVVFDAGRLARDRVGAGA